MVIASPAAAAKARVRRTVVQQPIFAVSAVPKRKRKVPRRKEADGKARVASEKDAPRGGRLRMHGPRRITIDEDDARHGLAQKTQRRTVHLNSVLASGAVDFDEAPGREEFDVGEEGALLHEERFNEYIDGNFDDAGAEVRSLDQRDCKVGLFGDWLDASGHGKCIEWVQDEATSLWRLDVIRGDDGQPLVPRPVAIMEFALKAARGDRSVPKGGRPEYRNGPWYKKVNGTRQGDRMRKAGQKAHGHGPYSKFKYRWWTGGRTLDPCQGKGKGKRIPGKR